MRTNDFQDFPPLIPPLSQKAIPSLSYFRQPFPPGQRSEELISQSLYFSSRKGVQLALLILITFGSAVKESEIDGILKNSLPGLERWLDGSESILLLQRTRVDQSEVPSTHIVA